VVRVVDNGPGIPTPIRERIFEPFFTTKPMGQGTGLGLDIVRRLVRHNDGTIEVDSQPGRTEFRVALPIAETPGAGLAQ
jgi:signal transduction histidine kinase